MRELVNDRSNLESYVWKHVAVSVAVRVNGGGKVYTSTFLRESVSRF